MAERRKPNKRKVLETDRKHIWHPFTQMKDYETIDPVVIERAKGIKLYDCDGNYYYDTISSWWTNTLGHRNPRMIKALKKQLDLIEHVNFSGFTHPYATELIEKLTEVLPAALSRFFFSDNGSTAVEVALKMAFQYWQNRGLKDKTRFVMLKNAYHGDTIGAVSVGGVELYHRIYQPLIFECHQAEGLNCSCCKHRKSDYTLDASETGCSLQCFSIIEEILKNHHNSIAAVIIEPLLQGAGGMLVYPAAYLAKLKEAAQRYNILLIFDEVATGFGRTGSLFAMDNAGVVPDMVCFSKALTAGYMPLALTVTTDAVYQAFYDDYEAYKTFFHGHSFTAYPLGCAAAVESLNIIKDEKLPFSKKEVLKQFHAELRQFSGLDYIGDIRYLGFAGAVDLVQNRAKQKNFDPKIRIGKQVYEESLKNNLVLRPLGDTIYWFLPLIVTESDIKTIMKKSRKVIEKTVREHLSS